MSDPYPSNDPVMRRVCRHASDIEVICLPPFPTTTRGEADLVRRLADQRGWTKIVVVSWRYHLPRARFVFSQCFSEQPGVVVFEAVPNRFHFAVWRWQFIYVYQIAGFVKAMLQGDCR
jgi:uncharacterized SAM-binding protein YcdF (DUF218 family)